MKKTTKVIMISLTAIIIIILTIIGASAEQVYEYKIDKCTNVTNIKINGDTNFNNETYLIGKGCDKVRVIIKGETNTTVNITIGYIYKNIIQKRYFEKNYTINETEETVYKERTIMIPKIELYKVSNTTTDIDGTNTTTIQIQTIEDKLTTMQIAIIVWGFIGALAITSMITESNKEKRARKKEKQIKEEKSCKKLQEKKL